MKNFEIINLYKDLVSVRGLRGVEVSYAIIRNINKLKPLVDSINEAAKTDDESVQEAEKHIFSLLEKYGKKGEDGKIEINNQGVVFEDAEAFDKAVEEYKKVNPEGLAAREEHLKKYNEFLAKENEEEVDLFKVDIDKLPEDITQDQMKKIFHIIKES